MKCLSNKDGESSNSISRILVFNWGGQKYSIDSIIILINLALNKTKTIIFPTLLNSYTPCKLFKNTFVQFEFHNLNSCVTNSDSKILTILTYNQLSDSLTFQQF